MRTTLDGICLSASAVRVLVVGTGEQRLSRNGNFDVRRRQIRSSRESGNVRSGRSLPRNVRRGSRGFQQLTTVAVVAVVFCLGGCRSRKHLPDAGSKMYREYVAAFYGGLAALQVGDDVRAEASLLEATTLVPGEPAGWLNWGILALRQRNFDAAAQRLNRAKELAPPSDAIAYLQGILESSRGDSAAAIADLREAIKMNPTNVRAMYLLASETERQGDANSEATSEELVGRILKVDANNTAALIEMSRIAAKRGDAVGLRDAVGRLASHEGGWPAEAKAQFQTLEAAASSDPRSAATRSTFLRNVLMRDPGFRADLADLKPQPGEEAQPVDRFFLLENLSSRPAPADVSIHFEEKGVSAFQDGAWSWVGAISLDGSGAPVIGAANAREVRLSTGARMPFPGGGASAMSPLPEGVLAFDYNYDFKTDLLLAGAGGVRLFRQETPQSFTDVTSSTKLPKAIADAAYTGAWAADIEADGDLDVVLGSKAEPPLVLRNNGDGSFDIAHPFAGVAGVRQFVWADLNGDGNPDAAMIDGSGRLRVFLNQRSGRFKEATLPDGLREVRAITSGDLGGGGPLSLIVAVDDGGLASLRYDAGSGSWKVKAVAPAGGKLDPIAEVRLLAADFDNNGAVDLLLADAGGGGREHGVAARLLLQGEHGAFHALPSSPELGRVLDAADLRGSGRLDLIGLSADGKVVVADNAGTKGYHWQTIRPRARVATGDQRVNSFGIGGEIEVRAGLLVQKQSITRPELHFGLGEQGSADLARIVWPNGSVRAEFNLKGDQQIVTEQRLKGSCPFLFAWNGSRMEFVKDSVPWGSAIGLRINSLGTAKVEATEEWYKIGRDELKPRDGYYDLRVTGELWESYYYDHLGLMAVDHPVGTEVFTDERFDVPAVKLAVTAVGEPQPIARAVDDNGEDVTSTVAKLDGKYLDTFGRGQYQGVTRDHYVEIDLGERAPRRGPLWLIAKGWLHPSDSSINVAMSQGKHEAPRWLSLEVADGRGGWKVARPNLGFPAGRKKICLIDLSGVFVPGAPRRLRLRTNLEIYWDSIEWAQGLPATELRVARLDPVVADLHYRGFSVVNQANASSPEVPDYNQLAGTAQRWRDLAGYYTRFGDVRDLLKETDDRYVIMNAGDELSLRFPAPPAPAAGWVRDFVIAGDGWIKDGDYNSTYSETVLPYPYHARKLYDTAPGDLKSDWVYQHHREDWQTYQTRYVTPEHFVNALGVIGR
jgi:tetratricopeptide (TPR) repeat protein